MRSLGPEEDTSKLVGIRRGLYDVTIATTVAAPVKRATETHFLQEPGSDVVCEKRRKS